MQDPPSTAELVAAVAEFIRDKAMPQLSGHTAYHARVAANVLDIVRRELALREPAEDQERARLQALLGSRTDDLAALNQLLCDRIERGEVTLQTAGLREHLWRVTLDKVAVDQPGYSAYQREKDRH